MSGDFQLIEWNFYLSHHGILVVSVSPNLTPLHKIFCIYFCFIYFYSLTIENENKRKNKPIMK